MAERRPEPSDRSPPALRLVRGQVGARTGSPATASGDQLLGATELSPALEDVVRRYASYVRRTAHRHGIDQAELDDLVQETRIRLWKSLGTSESIRSAPATYIYRTVMSAALDYLRRRRARREDRFDPEHATATAFTAAERADTTLVERETRDAVAKAVELLVESRRGVVKMYLAGYERDEIADLMGWTEAKTRNLLYRGLDDVRQTLISLGYGPGGRT